jgi:hypothetical protein
MLLPKAASSARPTCSSTVAMTFAAAAPPMISCARFGPVSAATGERHDLGARAGGEFDCHVAQTAQPDDAHAVARATPQCRFWERR